jgi:hypothetical protein
MPTGKMLLGAGSAMLQSFNPLKMVHEYSCGIHPYAGQLNRQVLAHHFCAHLGPEMRQCLIYDSNAEDAKLIGVEYMISQRLFESLPEEEKKMWHSHAFEVKGGVLVAPGLPAELENKLMQDLVGTYGKTWHFWQVDRDELPLGTPQLMMTAVEEGQLDPEAERMRDEVCGCKTADLVAQRKEIPDFKPHPDSLRILEVPSSNTVLENAPPARE